MTHDSKSTHEQTTAVINRLFECYLQKNLDGLLEIVGEECDWRFPGSQRILPWAGNYIGAEFTRFAQHIEESIEYIEYIVDAIHTHGELATIQSHEVCRVLSTGRVFKNELLVLAKVHDGKLVQFWEYSDTGAMEVAFQSR